MKGIVEIGMIMLVFGAGVLFPNHVLLSILTFIGVGINIGSFFIEKRELKRAIFYVRSKRKRSTFELIFNVFLVFAFGGSIYFLLQLMPKETWEKGMSLYLALIMFSTLFSSYYRNFTGSIRSFSSGIILPTFRKKAIKWDAINSFDIKNERVEITFGNEEIYYFEIDKRDIEEAINIKKQFEFFVSHNVIES